MPAECAVTLTYSWVPYKFWYISKLEDIPKWLLMQFLTKSKGRRAHDLSRNQLAKIYLCIKEEVPTNFGTSPSWKVPQNGFFNIYRLSQKVVAWFVKDWCISRLESKNTYIIGASLSCERHSFMSVPYSWWHTCHTCCQGISFYVACNGERSAR